MAVSLEARSPFLDHQLMEFAAHIPSDLKIHGMNTKYILKKAMRGILPEEVLRRTKKGFGVPIGYWFRAELRDWARQILLDSRSIERGYFNPQYVQAMLDEHASGRVDHGPRIWALLNLELWHRTYIDRSDFTQPISP
jgi:asparagine synthase (glutamine-hydrolysing)